MARLHRFTMRIRTPIKLSFKSTISRRELRHRPTFARRHLLRTRQGRRLTLTFFFESLGRTYQRWNCLNRAKTIWNEPRVIVGDPCFRTRKRKYLEATILSRLGLAVDVPIYSGPRKSGAKGVERRAPIMDVCPANSRRSSAARLATPPDARCAASIIGTL